MFTRLVIAFLVLALALALLGFAARCCGSGDLGCCSLLLYFSPFYLPRVMCNQTVDGIDQNVQIHRIAGIENGKSGIQFFDPALVSLCSPEPIWWRHNEKRAM